MASVATCSDDGAVAQVLRPTLGSAAQGLVLETTGASLDLRAVK